MFKYISWPIKVNAAIASFGISPNVFDSKIRSTVQTLGRNAGLTAQETALILVSLGVGIHYDDTFELILGTLRHDGKVDINKPEVTDALNEMNLSGDAHWEWDAINVLRGKYDEQELNDIDDYAKSPIAQLFAKFRWARIKDHVEQSESED